MASETQVDEFRVVAMSEVDPDKLNQFFMNTFHQAKAEFLVKHGHWWRKFNGDAPVLVRESDGEVIAYSSFIGVTVLYKGKARPMVWWHDMFVLKEYRGQRLQTRLNDRAKEQKILLGFPNEIGAKVYARDGWGVSKGIGVRLTLPFTPMVYKQISHNTTTKGQIARTVATVIAPLWKALKHLQYQGYRPAKMVEVKQVDKHKLAEIFRKYQVDDETLMTYRDEDYIQWRFFDAPYAGDFRYYIADSGNNGQVAVVTRSRLHHDLKTLRILDIFGQVGNMELMEDAIRTVLAQACKDGVDKVDIITTRPDIADLCRRLGFGIRDGVAFCWFSVDSTEHAEIGEMPDYWTFADYDFDINE